MRPFAHSNRPQVSTYEAPQKNFARAGNLWVASGVSYLNPRYDGGRFTPFTPNKRPPFSFRGPLPNRRVLGNAEPRPGVVITRSTSLRTERCSGSAHPNRAPRLRSSCL